MKPIIAGWQRICAAFPSRLKGVILVSARDVSGSLAELHRCAKESWPLAVFVYAPYQFPLDHPDLEPVWKAAADYDLSICAAHFHGDAALCARRFGLLDNLWLQRSAAHLWCGQRNMAAIIGAGIMDRYPNIRVGTLEAGHGWLPAWVNRLEEHTKLCPEALPQLSQTIREYVTGGRYFQSEVSRGAASLKWSLISGTITRVHGTTSFRRCGSPNRTSECRGPGDQ